MSGGDPFDDSDWDDDPLSDSFEDDEEEYDEELEEEHDTDDAPPVDDLDAGEPVEDEPTKRKERPARGKRLRVKRMPERMAAKFGQKAQSILITKINGCQIMFVR